MTTFGLVFFVGDISGGNAEATVVHVYSQEAYTVRFTTRDGETCVTEQKSTRNTGPVKVADTLRVHYSKISPCDNIEPPDDRFATYGAILLLPPAFLAVGCVNLRPLRRRV
jgi:hypothetical protein